ncbi:MAG TPA: hypothetical protein VNK95_16090, partial [Caldilineaceae bacterium]|nr:hypothetical protein [Caldilineaceae bacterium]
MSHRVRLLLVLSLVLGLLPLPTLLAPSLHAADAAVNDTPVRTIAETFTEFELGGGLLYWLNTCIVITAAGQEPPADEVQPAEATANEETLRRRPATGGLSRTLGAADYPDCNNFQGLAADETGVYFWDPDENAILKFAPDSAPGAAATKVVDTADGPVANGLQLTDKYIIWLARVNNTTRKLMRTLKDGSGPVETLFSDLPHTDTSHEGAVTAGASAIFYIDDGGITYV